MITVEGQVPLPHHHFTLHIIFMEKEGTIPKMYGPSDLLIHSINFFFNDFKYTALAGRDFPAHQFEFSKLHGSHRDVYFFRGSPDIRVSLSSTITHFNLLMTLKLVKTMMFHPKMKPSKEHCKQQSSRKITHQS